MSALVTAGVLLAAGAWLAAGYQPLASPGPISSGHAPVASQCAACHQPWHGVVDTRCERCHDPGARGDFAVNRHVATARRTSARAITGDARTQAVTCAACHVEHRGQPTTAMASRSAECATCHAIAWPDHPRFPTVAARRAAGPAEAGGLKFSHAIHMPEVRKSLGQSCEGCHRRAPDSPRFLPLEFDRDCASCHVRKGVLTAIRLDTDRPHRDAATLASAVRLAEQIQPGVTGAEQAAATRAAQAIAAAMAASADPPRPASPLDDEWAARRIPVIVPARSVRDAERQASLAAAQDEHRGRRAMIDGWVAAAVAPTVPSADPRRDLDRLLAPCLACHEPGPLGLRAVTAARPALVGVRFSHAPHVRLAGTTCETCHADIDRSGAAADVNLPDVTTCGTCHGVRREAPVACAACHPFHRFPPVPPPRS